MKKRALGGALLFALLFTGAPWLIGKTGCMSKSRHLKEKFDNKSYHYVSCTCPCDSYQAKGFYAQNKHQCLECGHRHDPQTVLILDKIPQARKSGIHLPDSAQTTIHRMISHWKEAKTTPSS
jgi:hypothetical protein